MTILFCIHMSPSHDLTSLRIAPANIVEKQHSRVSLSAFVVRGQQAKEQQLKLKISLRQLPRAAVTNQFLFSFDDSIFRDLSLALMFEIILRDSRKNLCKRPINSKAELSYVAQKSLYTMLVVSFK